MEDVPTRNIYKQDVRYEIVKDSMGIPNKIYNDESTQIRSVLKYNDKSYEWVRAKKNSSSSTKTTMNPKDIQDVSQKLINSMQAVLPLISYQSAGKTLANSKGRCRCKKNKAAT